MIKMNKHVFLLLIGLTIVAAGCTMAPKYARPNAPVPAEWPTGAAYTEAQCGNKCPGSPGPEMAGILHRREASTSHRDGLDEQPRPADCRPECGTGPGHVWHSASRTAASGQRRQPAGASNDCPPIFRPTGNAIPTQQYDVNLGVASWEIDFFGRIRSLKDRGAAGIPGHGAGPPQRADPAGVLGRRRLSGPGCGSGEPQAGGDHSSRRSRAPTT